MTTLEIWVIFSCPLSGYVIVSSTEPGQQVETLRVGPFRGVSFDRSGSAYGFPPSRNAELVPIADLFSHGGTWTVDRRHLPSGSGGLYRLMKIEAKTTEIMEDAP